jgi:hypothetical protein
MTRESLKVTFMPREPLKVTFMPRESPEVTFMLRHVLSLLCCTGFMGYGASSRVLSACSQ